MGRNLQKEKLPWNSKRLGPDHTTWLFLSLPLHKIAHNLHTTVSEAELEEMVKEKINRLRSEQGSQGIVV